MKLLRKRDIPEEKYSNAFLGFGPEDTNFAVELTYSTCHLFIYFYCLCSYFIIKSILQLKDSFLT